MMIVQTSEDGRNWANLGTIYGHTDMEFRSKAEAKKWYDTTFPTNAYEYRVGFLVRTVDNRETGVKGRFFRLVHKSNGKEVRY